MIKTIKKYGTNLAAIKMTPHLLSQLPAWYHIVADHRPMNRSTAKCLLKKHNVLMVADLIRTSARIRQRLPGEHNPNQESECEDCANN